MAITSTTKAFLTAVSIIVASVALAAVSTSCGATDAEVQKIRDMRKTEEAAPINTGTYTYVGRDVWRLDDKSNGVVCYLRGNVGIDCVVLPRDDR